MSKLQKKPSALKRGHSTLQNMNFNKFFFYFCGSFLPSWIRIRIPNPDPDPQTRLNPDPIRIRIHNPAKNNYYLKLFSENATLFSTESGSKLLGKCWIRIRTYTLKTLRNCNPGKYYIIHKVPVGTGTLFQKYYYVGTVWHCYWEYKLGQYFLKVNLK